MEIETTFNTTSSSSNMSSDDLKPNLVIKDQVRVKKKTLQTLLDHCQRALELLSNTPEILEDDDAASSPSDCEANELCDLLKSRLECAEFLEKLEQGKISNPQNFSEEGNSWDMVSENDLWEGEGVDSDKEDYVFVRQEDIVEGIACFMAAYLLSLKQTKDLTPNQLQDALSKTFSVKKKKGKLRKAWDGSKVLYNVASWGATAIGIYQNPVILRVASKAFWTSCHVISKLL